MSYTLDELCYIEKGKIGITKAVDGEYPLVTTGESFGTHNEYHFEGPAVCVPLVSSTGHGHASIKRLQYVEGKFACGNILAVLIPKDPKKLSAKYLYTYLTAHKQEKLVSKMKGAANVSLTLRNLGEVILEDLPSLEAQTYLTNNFLLINENLSRIGLLINGVDGLIVNLIGKMLDKTLIKSSYKFVEFASVCKKIGSGSTPRGAEYQKGGIPFIRSQNVYNSGLFLEDLVFIDIATNNKQKGTIVEKGDLLLNITGASIGRCCAFECNFEHANVNQHVSIIRVNSLVNNKFLHLVIMSPYFQKLIFENTTGAGRQGLPKYKLQKFKIPLPSIEEQLLIVGKFDDFYKKINEIKTSSSNQSKLIEELKSVSIGE